MKIEKRTIELEYAIPEGWRSLGRPPKLGEHYILPKCYCIPFPEIYPCTNVMDEMPLHLAIEKVESFVWPEWLYGWNGNAPIMRGQEYDNFKSYWSNNSGEKRRLSGVVDTSKFPQCDWERSLFKRPGKGE